MPGYAAAVMCAYPVSAGACRAMQPHVLPGLLLKALQQEALLRQANWKFYARTCPRVECQALPTRACSPTLAML